MRVRLECTLVDRTGWPAEGNANDFIQYRTSALGAVARPASWWCQPVFVSKCIHGVVRVWGSDRRCVIPRMGVKSGGVESRTGAKSGGEELHPTRERVLVGVNPRDSPPMDARGERCSGQGTSGASRETLGSCRWGRRVAAACVGKCSWVTGPPDTRDPRLRVSAPFLRDGSQWITRRGAR